MQLDLDSLPASLSRRVWGDFIRRSVIVGLLACLASVAVVQMVRAETWGEKLGYPAGKKVLILHADDIGMCYEANEAAKAYLKTGHIQSAALMVPCPWYNEMANWYIENPDYDLGLHLALTSEWKWYRWGPVAERAKVPGLIDNDGYLWRAVQSVVLAAKPEEIEAEIRAQINRAIARGTRPSHIDTHMGTLFARPDYTKVYLKVAEEFRIPAMAIEPTPKVMAKFKKQGYPVSEAGNKILTDYKLPKLDDFWAAPEGKTYEEKREKFFELVRSFDPGITEIIFHPSVQTEGLKAITGSWQQRVWEAQMFSDPAVLAFFEREGILFTNWKEIMRRFDKKEPATNKAGG
ncbi:MAG TPA: polysaccharide deacetylase family protein [Pirellulales bacterium]|jgi:hypothetical protein